MTLHCNRWLWAALILFALGPVAQTAQSESRSADVPASPIQPGTVVQALETPKPNYDKDVLGVLRDKRAKALAGIKVSCSAKGLRISSDGFACLPPSLDIPQGGSGEDGLVGTVGYSLVDGNCVDIAKAYGKDQPNNPISWVPTTQEPFIGAAVLFYFNHVAILTGVYSSGDVEVIQANSPGMPHRIPRSEIRGYF